VDINTAYRSITANVTDSAIESLCCWLDEECSELRDQMKQVKLQWLQGPIKNGDKICNVRRETEEISGKIEEMFSES